MSWAERREKAKAEEKRVSETQGGGWQRLGAGIAIPAIGAVYGERAIVPFNRYVNNVMLSGNRGDSTVSQSTVDSFITKNNLPVEIHKTHETHPFPDVSRETGPHALHMQSPGLGLDKHHVGMVGIHDNGVLMHELGHIVSHDAESKGIRLTKELMHHMDAQAHPSFISAVLASNDDTRAYAGVPLVVGDVADSINEMQANNAARKHILAEQGTAAARKFTRQMIIPNTLSYASIPAAKLGGIYAAGKLYEHVRDKYQMKKQAAHLPLHLEILKDFSVIGAADLAALAAYDRIHRNDEAPLVRIETPSSENRYINHIVKQAAASRIALRKVSVGADALSAKDGAYTRSLSHMPPDKDSIVKAATEDPEQTPYTPHYGRNAALTGAALSVPGLAYAGNAALHLNDTRVLGRLIALHGTAIGGVGALAGAATGAGLGLAATGVNHYLHRAREKQASDSEQTPYNTHYARNSLLAAGAAGATQIPGARRSYKEALEHAKDVRAYTQEVDGANGVLNAYYEMRKNPHLPFGSQLGVDLDLNIDAAQKALTQHNAARDHFMARSEQALDESANKAFRGGKLALGAGGLALAATGVNHYLHRAREKQAGWFSSGVDEVADVAIGAKNLTGSFTNHLTGRNVKDHMIDVTQPKNGKAVHELNKKTDEERYALTGEGSAEHAKLHDLIQKRKASRVLAGSVVGAGVLNYSNDTNHNGQNYGMVYQ